MNDNIFYFDKKLAGDLKPVYESHDSPAAVLLEHENDFAAASGALKAFCETLSDAVFMEGAADSPYPFLVPCGAFFYAIYSARESFNNFSGIDANRVDKIAGALKICGGARSPHPFDLLTSFYGFKRHDSASSGKAELFQQIINIISCISEKNDIVFHIGNCSSMDEDSVSLINYICRNVKNKKILFALSYSAASPPGSRLAAALKESVFGHFELEPAGRGESAQIIRAENMPAEDAAFLDYITAGSRSALKLAVKFLESSAILNYNPASSKYELNQGCQPGSIKKAFADAGPGRLPGASAAGRLDSVTLGVLKAASIFHGGFRCEEISACLQNDSPEIKTSLLRLRDAGILFRSAHGEIFRFAAPGCSALASSICTAEESAAYNDRIVDYYMRAAGSLPNIGLGRLIYHSMKSGRIEETVLFARRLAESLCEIDAAGNALKLIRFIRMAVLNKAGGANSAIEELKAQTELVYAKILILLGRFGAAHKILSRLCRMAPINAASAEAAPFAAEIYKWLGYAYMVKPALAGEDRDAALKAFMSALNRQMSNMKKRIETTNLIALMHYHRSELEKASIFYRDSLKTLAMKKNEDGLWLELDSAQRGLSSVYLRQGEFRKALAYLKKCEELCAAADNKKMLANTYHYIGMLHHSRGEYNDAIQSYEKAIEISDKISDILAQSRIWTSLGVTHHNLANYKTALSFFNRSMQVALDTGNKKAMAILNGNIARVQAVLNNISAAYFALKEDIAILDETRDLYGLAHAYAYLGDAYCMDAKDAEAHEYYLKSFEISKKSQFLRPLILSACGLIQSTPPHLLSQQAQSIVNELLLVDSREIDIVSKSMILRARCAYETAGGTYHRATCFINQALINFEKMNMPLETALCLIDEANIMKLNGLFDMAESKKSYAVEIFNKIGAEYYAKKYRGGK